MAIGRCGEPSGASKVLFIMALARLISKADFGVMSIALVVVGFVEIFAQIGIGPSFSADLPCVTFGQPCIFPLDWEPRFSR